MTARDLLVKWFGFPHTTLCPVLDLEEGRHKVGILSLLCPYSTLPSATFSAFAPAPHQLKTPGASRDHTIPLESYGLAHSSLAHSVCIFLGPMSSSPLPNPKAAHLGPGEAMVKIVFHLIVLRQAEEIAVLHVHQVLRLQGRTAGRGQSRAASD